MTLTRRIARLGSVAGLVSGLLAHHPAAAGQVAIFDRTVPQAAELAKILWPQATPDGRQYGRTRSIRLSAEPAPQAPAMAGPVVASAPAPEPVPPRAQAASAQPAPGPQAGGADAFGFPVRFAFDSAELLPESRPYLDSVGEMLRLPRAQGKRVLIVGHTDALGGEVYNQVLSERRAAAVRAYLAGRFGIPAELLLVEGEGKHEPLPGLDPRAPQNRRVEFHAAG
jgi:OmpA-OmpF porin, OOP family